MSRFETVLERQRAYGVRDWLFGIVALLVVVFHLAAFSNSEPLSLSGAQMTQPEELSAAQQIDQHTAETCGELDRAPDDLLC